MAYSTEWLLFSKAENHYFTCRYNFMRNEEVMASDLGEALTRASDNCTALRFLLEVEPKAAVVPLLSKIADLVIDSGNLTTIGLAKQVLEKYGSELGARNNILACATNYLAHNDEWHYRRIAELYTLLHYKEELAGLLALCRVSENLEIREVADDFQL